MPAIGIRLQQLTLVGLAPLIAILFWSGTNDPVNVVKATLAAVVALLLVVVSVVRTSATRRLVVARAPTTYAALAFALALIVATVTSDVPGLSAAGALGRNDGLLLYASCVVVFLVGARVLDAVAGRWLLWSLLAGGALSAVYGLLQRLGLDPINWANTGLSPVVGAFGNPDFESAYLGIVVPAAAWGVLTRTWSTRWRAASAAVGVSCLVVAALTSAVQGPLAAAGGLVVVAVGVLLERGGSWARRGLFGLAVVVAVGGAVTVLAVLSGIGPAQRIAGASSLTAREWYWSSALSMWRQHPVVGVGLDRFGAHYRSVRPSAAADVSNYSDAAHSVPLHLLATGGLLLGLAYLAVVALVAWALVTGLRRLAGEERLLLAALGGAWTAYQAQSLVSIDEPGLAVTHWVLASAVVAVSTPRLYERRLPGAVEPRVRKGRRADVAPAPPTVWSAGTVTICTLAGLAGVIAFWFALEPLRANYAARGASVALASGDGDTAFAKLNAATRIAPYEGSYWLQRGRFLEQVKQDSLAAQSYAAGVRHDPWSYDVLVAGARLAKAKQDASALDRYSHLLERVDPSGGWRQAVNG